MNCENYIKYNVFRFMWVSDEYYKNDDIISHRFVILKMDELKQIKIKNI